MISSKDILGQNEIIKHIKNAKITGKLSNAYIIQGEKGSGKRLIANYFATLLQCTGINNTSSEIDPCGKCHSCIQANTNNHPDIITITHEKPSIISIDEIRQQLVTDMDIKPYSSKYKIYIVPDADMMNIQAQNAILKTIEEPPEYGIVILLVENKEKMLQTILSRAVTFNIKPVSNKEIINYLDTKKGIHPEISKKSINFANGNIGKAIDIVSNENFIQKKSQVIEFLKLLDTKKLYDMEDAKNTFKEWKDEIYDYLDMMIVWYRDILVLKASNSNDDTLFYPEEKDCLLSKASIYTYEKINNIINSIEETKVRISSYVNFDLACEVLFMELKRK